MCSLAPSTCIRTEICCPPLLCSSVCNIFILQLLLRFFSLSLILSNLKMMCLSVVFTFPVLGMHQASWICVFIVVQSLSHVQFFVPPWTAAHQASLSFTVSPSLLKFMSIESVMLSNHLIVCHPLLLLPSVFPSINVFSSESALCIRWQAYWSFSISPENIQC